jgi:hypothetical protein
MTTTVRRTSVNTGTNDITTEIGKVGFVLMLTVGVVIGIISLTALAAGAIKVGGIIPLLGMMVGVL